MIIKVEQQRRRSLSQTQSDQQLTENRAMVSCNEGSFPASIYFDRGL